MGCVELCRSFCGLLPSFLSSASSPSVKQRLVGTSTLEAAAPEARINMMYLEMTVQRMPSRGQHQNNLVGNDTPENIAPEARAYIIWAPHSTVAAPLWTKAKARSPIVTRSRSNRGRPHGAQPLDKRFFEDFIRLFEDR